MRSWRWGIAAGVLAVGSLGACSDMTGGGSQPPKPVTMGRPTVAPDMVMQVQSKLRDGGYYRQGPIDGVWGRGTETAVRSFQHDHNLGSSGQLDVPTLEALNVTGSAQASNSTPRPPADVDAAPPPPVNPPPTTSPPAR
jgi:peptidoglycan hydrolase-like protein with peptidoglycan-binding domain